MKLYPVSSYVEPDQQQFYFSWGLEHLSTVGFLLHKWSFVASMALGAAAFLLIFAFLKRNGEESAGGIALVAGGAAGIGGSFLMKNVVATVEMAIQGVVMPYAPLLLGIVGVGALFLVAVRVWPRRPPPRRGNDLYREIEAFHREIMRDDPPAALPRRGQPKVIDHRREN